MGNVLEFPSQQAQGFAYLEREMGQLLRAKGADEPLITFATAQLTRIYSRVSDSEPDPLRITLPADLSETQRGELKQSMDEALQSLYRENHRLMLELVAQLVLAEVRLFQRARDD
jgi:hypothetical protein